MGYQQSIGVAIVAGFVTALLTLIGFIALRLWPAGEQAIEPIVQVLRTDAPVPFILTLCAMGTAEELAFREGIIRLVTTVGSQRMALLASVVIHPLVTTITGVIALSLAALIIGGIFASVRRVTGRVSAAAIAHCTWTSVTISTLLIIL